MKDGTVTGDRSQWWWRWSACYLPVPHLNKRSQAMVSVQEGNNIHEALGINYIVKASGTRGVKHF